MIKAKPLPDIEIMKAHCVKFESGFCYSANNPYYSGHYATKEEAAGAARGVLVPPADQTHTENKG